MAEDDVNVGAIVPNSGPLPERLGLAAMGRTAEEAGAGSLWVSDHLLMVDRPVDDYPYSADGNITWDARQDFYEALTCCTHLAAVTTRCRIGTAVLIMPQRNVLQLAKEAATIDRLAGGRLELGVGVGWSAAEMTALGHDFGGRGRRFEEMIAVLRGCWTGRTEEFHGAALDVPGGLVLMPRPVRPLGPPLLLGGMTPVAIRRAAALGDGWLAIGFVDDWDPLGLAARLKEFRVRWNDLARGGAPRAVLKLHCRAGFDRLRECTRWALRAGFDEVMVDLPWSRGLGAAAETFEAVTARGTP